MCTYRNGLRMLTGILCIAVTVFIFTAFANADDEVQYKSYDLKGYSGSVEVDQSVRDKIQDKAIKEIAGETKSKTIRITAMENLSEENLQASEEEALYVYTDKGLTHIQPGFPNNHTSIQESSNNFCYFWRASNGLTPRSRYSCSCFIRTSPCAGAFPGSR